MIENVSPKDVWSKLQTDPQARLVDVRTDREWATIGTPDLSAAGQAPVLISWQVYPSMAVNPGFVEEMRQSGLLPEHKIYFLCRSGVRSQAAAQMAEAMGFPSVFNIADGFEGPPDRNGQRGHVAGWQAEGLPATAGGASGG